MMQHIVNRYIKVIMMKMRMRIALHFAKACFS